MDTVAKLKGREEGGAVRAGSPVAAVKHSCAQMGVRKLSPSRQRRHE
jgi:hypothetical protein